MWLRLRQIAGVAAELKPVEDDLIDILGIAVSYRDPHIDYFGLENALFPIGNQLLEVVGAEILLLCQPDKPDLLWTMVKESCSEGISSNRIIAQN